MEFVELPGRDGGARVNDRFGEFTMAASGRYAPVVVPKADAHDF